MRPRGNDRSGRSAFGWVLLVVLACLLINASASAQTLMAPPYYKVVDLGPLPGGTTSSAFAVNDPPRPNGIDTDYLSQITVVGQAKIGTKLVPFRWRNGVIEVIGDPATMKSGIARDVNSSGKIVGEWADTATSRRHAFVFDEANGFRELLKADATHLQASAWSINEQGKIAGYSLGSQAIPVRWDPDGTGVYPTAPAKLYTGAPLTFNSQSCVWQGHAFNIGYPISINEAGHAFSSWTITVTSECGWPPGYTVKSTYVYAAAKTENNGATWTTFGPPSYVCYPYWANYKYYECANSKGIAINNLDTTLHLGAFYSNSPGLPMWDQEGVVRPADLTSKVYFRNKTCLGIQFSPTAINDDNIFVGSTLFQDNISTNCLDGQPYKTDWRGFVIQHGPNPQYYYLMERIPPDCGWMRLLPNDINNAGVIVGGGLHTDGSAHAFMLIPTDTLPGPEGCIGHGESAETNHPPIANAGPDQTLEATSPAGAEVTLTGASSIDPDNDPLTYEWTTPFSTLSGVSPTVTLPIGVHAISLTVDDEHGGTDNDSVIITVQDTTPPDTTITAHPDAITNSASPSFSFEGTDVATPPEALTFECSLDSGPWTACTSGFAYTDLADGAHTFEVRAKDDAGNVDPSPAFFLWTIDTVPPVITIATPADGASYLMGLSITADYECSDALSGLVSCAGPVANGATMNLNSVGPKSFAVTATDKAGNVATLSHSYRVAYAFSDFDHPIQPLPVINEASAGRTVPVKWQLKDGNGNTITGLDTFTSMLASPISCDASPSVILSDEVTATGGTTLRFDSGTGRFIFNWQTASNWTGCYVLQLTLADGTQHYAKFKFR